MIRTNGIAIRRRGDQVGYCHPWRNAVRRAKYRVLFQGIQKQRCDEGIANLRRAAGHAAGSIVSMIFIPYPALPDKPERQPADAIFRRTLQQCSLVIVAPARLPGGITCCQEKGEQENSGRPPAEPAHTFFSSCRMNLKQKYPSSS